jgi:hypothetical protein
MPATAPQPVEATPREHIDTAVVEGIRLLEAEDYEGFVSAFVKPDDLLIVAPTPDALAAHAKDFGANRAASWLDALRDIRGRTPVLDAAETSATFVLARPLAFKQTLTFVKIGKYWYIGN